jgi:hypothetical protein
MKHCSFPDTTMSLRIKHPEAHRLAGKVAKAVGETRINTANRTTDRYYERVGGAVQTLRRCARLEYAAPAALLDSIRE